MAISSNATGLRPGVCTSTTRPTTPYTGQIIYETDTGYLRVWDGAAWDYLSQKQDDTVGLGPVGGLVLVGSQSFTSQSSVLIDNVFSSNYAVYRAVLTVTSCAGGAAEIQMVFRTAGSDVLGTGYSFCFMSNSYANAVTSAAASGRNNMYIWRTNGATVFSGNADISYPNLAQPTFVDARFSDPSQGGWTSGYHNGNNQFDGIRVQNAGSANMTGVLRIYGYRNS